MPPSIESHTDHQSGRARLMILLLLLAAALCAAPSGSGAQQDTPLQVAVDAPRLLPRANARVRHPEDRHVVIRGLDVQGDVKRGVVLRALLFGGDFAPGAQYCAVYYLLRHLPGAVTHREPLCRVDFTREDVAEQPLECEIPPRSGGPVSLELVLFDAFPGLDADEAFLSVRRATLVMTTPPPDNANAGEHAGEIGAEPGGKREEDHEKPHGQGGAKTQDSPGLPGSPFQGTAAEPFEPEIAITKPFCGASLAEKKKHIAGLPVEIEVAAYDVPIELPDGNRSCEDWHLVVKVYACVTVSQCQQDALWSREDTLCSCTHATEEHKEGGMKPEENHDSAGKLVCRHTLDDVQVGLHGLRAGLLDPSGNLRSETHAIFRVWPHTPSVLQSLPCLQDPQHLSVHTSACVWYWKSIQPSAIVYVSQQQISSIDSRGKIRGGTWGWLMSHFAGIPVNHSAFLRSLPKKGYVSTILQGEGATGGSSCAVVGSAWHLQDSELGREIDGHDYVVRVNDAPTQGYESDVGARTTHRVFGCRRPKSPYPLNETIIYHLGAVEDVAEFVEEERRRQGRAFLLSPSFAEYILRNFFDDPDAQIKLTTGMVAVFWALHSCSQVHTYGFGGGAVREGPRVAKSRYFVDTVSDKPYYGDIDAVHDWEMENLIHNRLEEAGALERRFKQFSSYLRHEVGELNFLGPTAAGKSTHRGKSM